MTDFKDGDRVKLTRQIETYPIGVFEAGLTGTVVDVDPTNRTVIFCVRLDQNFPALEEWDNAVQVGPEGSDEAWVYPSCFTLIETESK